MSALWLAVAAGAAEWRLVGAYDAAALGVLGEVDRGYVWQGARGMTESCGRAKGPDGLGIFEAEAVASGLTPALVLLLERTSGEGGLGTDDVRLAVTDGPDRRVLLQPMVRPRSLAITLDVPADLARYGQLVRTQLEVETCLEHKTGRGWTGHDARRVRQAFLLEEPIGGERSRKFFGGQLDPVPALLGPPDACVRGPAPQRPERPVDSSLWLVPTDIWGAGLRACPAELRPGPAEVPIRFGGPVLRSLGPDPRSGWTEVTFALSLVGGGGAEEERVRVGVTADGRALASDLPLYERGPGGLGQRDLLAVLRHEYPMVDGRVALVVPEWQLVEALRRLEREGDPAAPLEAPPAGVFDAVGALLSHPERLSLQVRPAAGDDWPNLAGVLEGGLLGEPFGFTAGYLASREPVALLGGTPADLESARGQRSRETAILLGGLALVALGVAAGVARLRDLWARIPHERAHYWPGLEKPLFDARNTPDAPTGGSA